MGNVFSDIHQGAGLHTIHPTFAQVKATRELFTILLGTRQSGPAEKNEIHVELAKQILLSPWAAKNLAVKLNEAIRSHEARFGQLDKKVFRYRMLAPTPRLIPPEFRSAEGAEKIETCFRLLDKFNIRAAFERSFQMQKEKLLKNRFLFGFDVNSISSGAHEKILHICEQLGMPAVLMADYKKNLPQATVVGFGFGEDERTCIIRAYLEFRSRYYRAMNDKTMNAEPYLSHLGFKWDAADSRMGATTKYTCFPGYTTEDILKKIVSQGSYQGRRGGSYGIVEGVLNLASTKVRNDKFLFLDVSEESSGRNSFDINLYRANLQLNEIYPFLLEACRFFSISENEFHDFYEPVKTQTLGHLAGGMDRDGRDFLGIYFGE